MYREDCLEEEFYQTSKRGRGHNYSCIHFFKNLSSLSLRTNNPPWHTKENEDILTDTHRLAQRQKQIEFGKNTVGYETYLATLPK